MHEAYKYALWAERRASAILKHVVRVLTTDIYKSTTEYKKYKTII
jgi:hypothetical protein